MASSKEHEEPCPAPNVMVVREVYDSNGAHEQFALELERCLEAGPNTIVIEPAALGDETARWIAVGNCLHKTAVLAGFGSLFGAWAAPERLVAWAPLGTLSLACTAIYTASWQFDPCCQYQVEMDSGRLSRLMLESVVSSTPVVLVRREDGRRKVLHSSISVLAGALCLYRLYQMYK
ncbi:transmembrane protein 11, mitochondrial [Hyalella azteca]|uniref:Transmembrane protein 11, mitochondrial n=1 Tax=Hyalella azteca TaxID=294128 RepID=A0A8B7PIZ0_HYAAZ|nr:transmembrane protein 11, mitochondrial [Hyalella azteca]